VVEGIREEAVEIDIFTIGSGEQFFILNDYGEETPTS